MGYRVGVDVGGTFTDLICVTPAGEIVLDKTPTTLDDQSRGVMNGLAQLADRFGLSVPEFCAQLDILVHGTTTADNTMIEMNGANTGLLVTEGHRDEIELRRCHKEQIWDPNAAGPDPHRPPPGADPDPGTHGPHRPSHPRARRTAGPARRATTEAVGRHVGRGDVPVLVREPRPRDAARARSILEEFPDVEHISLSHEVMPRGPEFERVSTTLVNAYVAPRIAHYTSHLQDELRRAGYGGPLLIMQSTGGVMPPDYVARRAVTLLASGPTGGVMGATLAANRADAGDFLAVDMGGTSFDICLVRHGQPQIKTDWNWRYRYYIGLPMVDVQSVGAGGGSIARVRQGALLVGPESAGFGARSGLLLPRRCAARPSPTPTPRSATSPPTDSRAGACTSTSRAAENAILNHVAEPLGLDVTEAAWGIERIVNANMANASRKILASHGADARQLSLIAYGGNGAVHACAVAKELGIKRIYVPKAAPAFSALGVLVADYVVDLVRSYVTPLSQVDLSRVRSLMTELDGEVSKELEPAGLDAAETITTLYVQMCYPGQNFDMSVPGARRRGARRARSARPRRALPRPARGRAGLLLPQPTARRPRRARHGPRLHPEARSLRRSRRGERRGTSPRRAPAAPTGARRGSTRRSTTARSSVPAPTSKDPR